MEEAPITSLYKIRNINEAQSALIVAVEHYLSDKLSKAFTYEERTDGSRVFEIPSQEVIETVEGTEIVWETIESTNKIMLPGYTGDPIYLQNLLGVVEASENASILSSIVKLEARKSHILSIFPEALNKSLREFSRTRNQYS